MSGFLSEQEVQTFTNLTTNYQMNPSARRQFINSNFAIIAGPTGAGKDTLRNRLIAKYPDRYVPILSTTTRLQRAGEQDGVDYHFRSKQQVRQSLEQGEFFQAALVHNQQVSCLHISEIRKLKPKQVGVSILIVQTEIELARKKPDIKTIFLIPPNLAELKRRMQASRSLTREETQRRLQAAKTELEVALSAERYYCLINEDLTETMSLARDFFENNKKEKAQVKRARKTISEIHSKLEKDIIS